MTHTARSTRTRVAALAAGLALSLSIVAAPAAVAQYDTPEAAVQGFLDDIQALNIEAIPGWFCDAFADQAATFDMSELTASLPPGTDAESVLGSFSFDVDVESIETISQTDTEATVNVVATLAMNIDVAGLEPLIVGLLEAGGQEATPDMVAMVGGLMASELGDESIDISEEIVIVVNEDGTWGKICSELGDDDGETEEASPSSADPAAVEDPVSE